MTFGLFNMRNAEQKVVTSTYLREMRTFLVTRVPYAFLNLHDSFHITRLLPRFNGNTLHLNFCPPRGSLFSLAKDFVKNLDQRMNISTNSE